MFRKLLTDDIKAVFDVKNVRLCAVDDETECIYFNPTEIVSTPIVGSGTTHFRVYGTLGINQDEKNGVFGYIHHKLLQSTKEQAKRFQLQGDEQSMTQTLYDQHRILSTVACVWESDIDWNKAPDVEGGKVELENE